jgi:hypothetical protein
LIGAIVFEICSGSTLVFDDSSPLTCSTLTKTQLEKTVPYGRGIVKRILAKGYKYNILVSIAKNPSEEASTELGTEKSGFSLRERFMPLQIPVRYADKPRSKSLSYSLNA